MTRLDSVTIGVAIGASALLVGGLVGAGGFLLNRFDVMLMGTITAAAGAAIILGVAFYHSFKEELAKNEKENFIRDYGAKLSTMLHNLPKILSTPVARDGNYPL